MINLNMGGTSKVGAGENIAGGGARGTVATFKKWDGGNAVRIALACVIHSRALLYGFAYKAAQNMQVLPSRLPRSGMAFSPQHPGFWALLVRCETGAFSPLVCLS